MAEMDRHNGVEHMSVSGCEQLVVDVVKNQNKKFVVFMMLLSVLIFYDRVDGNDTCLNIYDVRLHDTAPACGMNWPPDIKPITDYLRVCLLIAKVHPED